MKYPRLRFVFDRRREATSTIPGRIELELTLDYKQKRIATGVKVLPKQWDQASGVIRHPDACTLNMRLNAVRKPVADYIARLMIDCTPFSFEEFDLEFRKKKKEAPVSFREYVATRIEERNDIREITRTGHRSLLSALDGFKHIKTMESLTVDIIREFDTWLKGKHYASTTIGKYHKVMKCYINIAKGEGLIDRNPYDSFKVSKGKPKGRRYLTDEELSAVMEMEPFDPTVARARDLFVFQCFTGLAYADLVRFDFNRVEEHNGKFSIRDVRHKSGEEFYIVLTKPAMEILRKYEFSLPIVSNQKYNATLKAIGAVTGKYITSHCARHTFATMCLNRGIPIEVVSRMIGHANIKTTQIYAKILDKTIDRAFDILVENH